MSEEVIGQDLEAEDAPAVPPVEETPPLQEVQPEAEPEGVAHDKAIAGLKAELIEERRERQRLTQWANKAQPYVEFLTAHPELLTRQTTTQQPAPQQAPEADAKIVAIAKALDLYTADAKPDLERARTILGMIKEEAEEIADERVRPLAQNSAAEKAARNFQRASMVKTPDGRSPDKETLQYFWNQMPAEYTADERVAAVATYAAMGYQLMHGQQPPPQAPTQDPLVTESAGGRTPGRVSLSALDHKIMEMRGVKDAGAWQALVKGHTAGRPSTLEDD